MGLKRAEQELIEGDTTIRGTIRTTISIGLAEQCITDSHRPNIDHLTDNTQRDHHQVTIVIHHEAHSQYKVEINTMVVNSFRVLEMKLVAHA